MNDDVYDKNKPVLYKIEEGAVEKRPFDRAFRWAVYFPGTDFVVNDMGGRGTGRPIKYTEYKEEFKL